MRYGALALLLAAGCSSGTHHDGLIILAIDGMDPNLLADLMEEGRMPNFTRLAVEGGFTPLGTSTPPQSPVAWSNFLTGHDSHVHGIYDFVHRDPSNMSPYLSTSKAEGPAYVVDIGDITLPIGGGVKLLRRGHPFWSDVANDGHPTTVVKIPANYPPVEPSDAEVLSGMGTPDLLGTPGLFQVLTMDPLILGKGSISGGRVHVLEMLTPTEAQGALDGPPDPLTPEGTTMRLPVNIYFGEKADSAVVRIGEAEVLLSEGEWSDWIELEFATSIEALTVTGIVRVYAKSLGDTPTIYFTPVNLDPLAPAQPISAPDEYASELATDVGRYYTQGMPEDTKALVGGVLSDEDFLAQEHIVFEERHAMLQRELKRFDDGFLFFYFSSVDLVSHMFWRALKPNASKADKKHADVIPALYAKMDGVLGEVLEAAGDDTTVIVMSDHGFAPYDTKVHLNTWLARKGYLALAAKEDVVPGVLGHIDWKRTRAYALGLNQLFLNRVGREPGGIVTDDEAPWLLEELARELEDFVDPRTGDQVVTRVFTPHQGTFLNRVPDLIVGYNRSFRSSDESALGQVGTRVLEVNTDKWSGDHCMDPQHVPGVLLTNRKLEEGKWSLTDVAPTVRSFFDIDEGQSFLAPQPDG